MRIVAFVPAKGESNRIRNKNTVILDGEHLFKRKLRQLLQVCGQRKWQLTELDADPHDYERDQVGVTMTLTGSKVINAAQALASVDGVSAVVPAEEEPD